MSWQQYVDSNLQCAVDAEGHTLSSSCIAGLDGSVWAQSEAFPGFSGEEVGRGICSCRCICVSFSFCSALTSNARCCYFRSRA